MRNYDLGQCDHPLLIFGGPYSNLQALQAVLHRAKMRGIPGAAIICTGDIVAYCGDPAQTVAAVQDSGMTVVAGNCEIQLAQGALDCGCGFEDGSVCDRLSAGWFAHATAEVSSAQKAWMATLPDIVTFRHAGRRYGVLHGGASDVARFLWSCSSAAELEAEWRLAEAQVGPLDVIIAGHSGIPFVRELACGTWVNAGVIGMPPNDGHAETRFCVLEDGIPLMHHLEYDVQAAVTSMKNARLVQGYDKALLSGYWPSEDVLPDPLRREVLASG